MQTPMQRAAAAGRRGRSIVMLLILVVIVSATYGVRAFITRTRVPTSAGPPGWTVYHDPANKWTLQFPSGWHAQGLKEFRPGRHSFGASGVLLSNIDRHAPKGSDGLGSFDMRGVPPTLVAVKVAWGYGGPFPARPCTDTPIPLNLLRASRTTTVTGAGGTTQLHLQTGFNAKGKVYGIEAWIGSRATKADRERLDRIVASISFAGVKMAKYENGLSCSDNL